MILGMMRNQVIMKTHNGCKQPSVKDGMLKHGDIVALDDNNYHFMRQLAPLRRRSTAGTADGCFTTIEYIDSLIHFLSCWILYCDWFIDRKVVQIYDRLIILPHHP